MRHLLLVFLTFSLAKPAIAETEFLGKVGGEALLFSDKASHSEQESQYYSLTVEPEFTHILNNSQEIKGKLFYRYDSHSNSRTHGDIRELMINHFADDWELNFGIGKVFWGTTESIHLVDVINQVDWAESLDDEARLGQPMIQAKWIKDWGAVDLFVLPYFRPVEYLDNQARPRLNPTINNKAAIYQSDAKAKNVDFALRWNHSIEDLELGVSYFTGTQRAPLLTMTQQGLTPVYVQTQQLGLDAQLIVDDWLIKAELLGRDSHNAQFHTQHSFAAVAGFEYTLVGIADTAYDLGIIGEYLHDDWQAITPFQKDWMTGLRWVMNDEQSTEVLLGNIIDLDDGTQTWRLEASRRIGDNFKAELIARWFANIDKQNLFKTYEKDNLVSARLYYYF